MATEPSYLFTVGTFVRPAIRRYLDLCQFNGNEIDWFEDKGWFESNFRLKGKDAARVYLELVAQCRVKGLYTQ